MPRVFDLIQPLDTRDTYAITDVIFQKGGLREVQDIAAMNFISTERRRKGMLVFIIETGEFYGLTGSDLTNESWQKIDFSNSVSNNISINELTIKETENSISDTSGDDLSLTVTDASILKLTDGSSIGSLINENVQDGKLLFLQNLTGSTVVIKNNYVTAIGNLYPILTGTSDNINLLAEASTLLQFSEEDMAWRIIGGMALNPTFLSLIDTPNSYPTVSTNNNVFLLVNPNSESEDKIIFDNPIPVVANNSSDLVVNSINGLRIRRFDSTTGEIIFAKFEPTITMSANSPINFDDQINSITGIFVTNDNFITDRKVITVESIKYYKNGNSGNLISISTTPSTPTTPNNNYSWSQGFSFSTIPDINTSFGTSPTTFTIKANLVDTLSVPYEITKTITITIPNFSFSISSKTDDFRNQMTSCVLTLSYSNVTSRTVNSSITSITSNTPNTPTFNSFTNGMTSYTASGLTINAENVTKTTNLSDTGSFSFTTVCRYTRPLAIDADQNYYQITATANLNVTFTYPIFTGNSATSKTSLTASETTALTNSGNTSLPRSFSYTVGSTNQHWWFCLRKRYVNNRTPNVTLTSGGFTLPTVIIYSNEVDVTTYASTETYVCYCILLQANNSYTVNISI